MFNDEAHHIHEFKREGETTEVEWQKSLTRIAGSKGRRFVQVDFSATPYNDVGAGKNKRKVYFPHIVTDFDLKTAMQAGWSSRWCWTGARRLARCLWNSKPNGMRTATRS